MFFLLFLLLLLSFDFLFPQALSAALAKIVYTKQYFPSMIKISQKNMAITKSSIRFIFYSMKYSFKDELLTHLLKNLLKYYNSFKRITSRNWSNPVQRLF